MPVADGTGSESGCCRDSGPATHHVTLGRDPICASVSPAEIVQLPPIVVETTGCKVLGTRQMLAPKEQCPRACSLQGKHADTR